MVLNAIKSLLENEEYGCTLSPASQQIPVDRLLVFLGLDDKKRERLLEIVASPPLPTQEFALPSNAVLPIRIQFGVKLPFKVQDLSLNQASSLLLFLNQMLDMPGFELNELEGTILYRYVWIIHPTAIDGPLLMSILGAIMVNLGLFSDSIESVASGKMSFNDLLEEVVKMSKNKTL